MADLTAPGDGIEGKGVRGNSRDPLRARGLFRMNGVGCFRFTASFNVSAAIVAPPVPGKPRIVPSASVLPSDRIVCDVAAIHRMKRKYSSEVRRGSHRHQSNFWDFSSQTSVVIQFSHKEIADAKRRGGQEKSIALSVGTENGRKRMP